MLYDHNIGKGHLRSPGQKRSNQKMDIGRYVVSINVLRSDFRKEHTKMTLKHFLKRQHRSNFFRKIIVKSRYDVKSACFFTFFMS